MKCMKSYAEFIRGAVAAMLVDAAEHFPDSRSIVEFNRDLKRIGSAIDHHGIKFVLDTMPAYRKHFDKCLDAGRLTPSGLIHFGPAKRGETIPRLFRGLFLRVFDRYGSLREQPDELAIFFIRQLLGACRKLRMASSIRDTREAIREFFQVDMEVDLGDLSWSGQDSFVADMAVGLSCRDYHSDPVTPGAVMPQPHANTIGPVELEIVQQVADLVTAQLGEFYPDDWRPRHGPGAVADQHFGAYKYDFKNWSDRLDAVFPSALFAYANYRALDPDREYPWGAAYDEYRREPQAKLCAVPKTLSKPRLIASEPTSAQWCQQIVRDYFYTRVARTPLSSFVDFRRQDKNAGLALWASQTGHLATIDLSMASDRISCKLVERIFRRSPKLLEALYATRTRTVRQDICRMSPKVYNLRKYSTMGNATTFPVQSIIFAVLALAAVSIERGYPVSYATMGRLRREGEVHVFGDDIVVPVDCYPVMVELLHTFGLKVNTNKTFAEGNFRESCGVDAYAGHNVTTINILDVPRRASPGSIVSTVDVHHNLLEKGLMHTAQWLRTTACRLGFANKIRVVKHRSGLFGWSDLVGDEGPKLKTRFNRNLHIREALCLRLKVSEQRLEAKESAGLLQFFTEAPKRVTSAKSTLGYLARRPKVGLALGWVPAV